MELMEGLTVLSTSTQNGIGGKILLTVCGLLTVVLAIVFFIFAIMTFSEREVAVGVYMMVASVCMTFLCVMSLSCAMQKTKTIYKVTIDKNVSFAEFHERYKIIDQDGLIYEIVAKEE